jgi:hypothetical protein
MNRHPYSLREPKAVSMSRPESQNKKDINDFFSKATLVTNDCGVFDKTNLICNVEEKDYVLQNLMAEGELVITATNCGNNGHYCTIPIVILGSARWRSG